MVQHLMFWTWGVGVGEIDVGKKTGSYWSRVSNNFGEREGCQCVSQGHLLGHRGEVVSVLQ